MSVAMAGAAVGVRGTEFDIDQVQHTVAHSALGNHCLGELTHALDRTLEHHGLQALIMINVGVHGGNGKVVMGVLNIRQALSEIALMVIVHVG
jgi:hypothetical protein